jgi:hypothetical protein
MRGDLIEVDVINFFERWIKEMLFFNLRGLIKMSEQWLDYYFFDKV